MTSAQHTALREALAEAESFDWSPRCEWRKSGRGQCRNPEGCHCAEIKSLVIASRRKDAENADLSRRLAEAERERGPLASKALHEALTREPIQVAPELIDEAVRVTLDRIDTAYRSGDEAHASFIALWVDWFIQSWARAESALAAERTRADGLATAVEPILRLVDELCDAVDAEGDDVGGHRGSLVILREIGPAIGPALEAAKRVRSAITGGTDAQP